MDINKYTGYFHDGTILNIKSKNNEIEIWMESNQLLPEWNEDNIFLSKFETIRGILHFIKIKSISVNDKSVEHLKFAYDDGEISRFHIYGDTVELAVAWSNFPPKERLFQFDNIIIKAEKIIWENLPELLDLMGL